jgi:hypothetical protein
MKIRQLIAAAVCLISAALPLGGALAQTGDQGVSTKGEMPTHYWSLTLSSTGGLSGSYTHRFGDAFTLRGSLGLVSYFSGEKKLYGDYYGIAPLMAVEGRLFSAPHRSGRQVAPSGFFFSALTEATLPDLVFLKESKSDAVSEFLWMYGGIGVGYLYRPTRHFSVALEVPVGAEFVWYGESSDTVMTVYPRLELSYSF